jgi:hypothetical protein
MKTTLEAILITALLMLPGFVRSETIDPAFQPQVGFYNWDIKKNAEIENQLRYERLRPPVKIVIEQTAPQPYNPYYIQPVAPVAPIAPQVYKPYQPYNPSVDYGVFGDK